jgi:hypothetical protein
MDWQPGSDGGEGPADGSDSRLRAGQNIDVEFVALGVGHATPLETLELADVSRFEPPAAEPRYFRGRPVEVVDHQVEVDPVLTASRPPQNPASAAGSAASITRYPTFAFAACQSPNQRDLP